MLLQKARPLMDDDEKVRRNLVVFSSSVLVANYLEISFTKLATQFLKLEQTDLNPLKVATLSLLILIYLAVRYRFSEEGVKYSETMKLEWKELCQARVQCWCKAAVLLYLNGGIAVQRIFVGSLVDVLRSTSGAAYQVNNGKLPKVREVQFVMSNAGTAPWKYQAFVKFQWILPLSGEGLSTEGLIDVELTGAPLLALKAMTTLEMWSYSKGSINALIPVVLGILAAFALVIKVINLVL